MNQYTYPVMPSVGVQDTSRLAAEAIAPNVQTLREKALALIAERPSTADEVAEAMNESVLAVRFACGRLYSDGITVNVGHRLNGFHRHAVIWKLTKTAR